MGLSQIMTNKHKTDNRTRNTATLKDQCIFPHEVVVKKYKGHRILRYHWWKGLIDFLMASIFLVVLSPFIALIAIAIKIDSRGEVIYRREQVGENGHNFTAYKFRTMKADNDDSEYKEYLVKYITLLMKLRVN